MISECYYIMGGVISHLLLHTTLHTPFALKIVTSHHTNTHI